MTVLRDPRVEVRPLAPGLYRQVHDLVGWNEQVIGAPGDDEIRRLWAGVLLQSSVHDVHTDALLGVVTCYDADLRNGHAWIAVRARPTSIGSGLVLLGLGHFIGSLFADWPFRCLHAETSPEVFAQVRSGWGTVVEVSGRLLGYHLIDDEPVDRILLTIGRDQWLSGIGPRLERRRSLACLATVTP